MFIGTHALLPVAVALAWDDSRLGAGRGETFPAWSLPAFALFGALPDLCSPHLSLEARYTSLSHTLLFLGILVPVVIALARLFPKGSRLLVGLGAWSAAVLHLAADAISGGIPWLQPWSGHTLGTYVIDPAWWVASDAAFMFGTWLLWAVRRELRVRSIRRAAARMD